MKRKIIFKSIIFTLVVVLILAVAAFGITSLVAPAAMMRFTASLGLTEISADYAFQEYERSGSISCLARSFVVAAEHKRDRTAVERFDLLYAYDNGETTFADFCNEQDKLLSAEKLEMSYRDYVCGLGACAKYRLAQSEEELLAVIDFAMSETDAAFSVGNPMMILSIEAIGASDAQFCAQLLETIESADFEGGEFYEDIVRLLNAYSAQ